jgi:hypothetical protein
MNDWKSKKTKSNEGAGAEDDSHHAQDESKDSDHEDLWSTIFCPEKSCEVLENTNLP